MDFWDRFATVAAERNVLEHPFYVRWTEGNLTREELAEYAGQYRHAVVALSQASANAAPRSYPELREHLDEHAAEEAGHVELWDRFVGATGGDSAAAANESTQACADAWAGARRTPAETLAALYAIESAQPQIAAVKRAGLVDLYGFAAGPATDYFDVHAELDHEHAASHREFLERELAAGADGDALLAAAADVLDGNWKLLDGVSPVA
jgi:pyrroloquinoline-quinone synthase